MKFFHHIKYSYISAAAHRLGKFCLVAIVMLFLGKSSWAQDIHFSQFESSPLNLNPALTGFFNGDYRLALIHRNQWKSVTKPYNTLSGSFDMALNGLSSSRNRYSAGIIVNNDKAGDSELGFFEVGLSFGMLRAVDRDSLHFISGGLQIGYVRHSINYTSLTFDEQYDGDVFDPDASNGEDFGGETHSYIDFNAGLGWMFQATDRVKIGAGISIQHINRPNDSFYGDDAKIFPHLQADLKADFPIAGKLDLVPALLYMAQGGYSELTGGTSLRFRLNDLPGRQYAFLIGGWMRKSDAVIASAGLEYNNLNVGVSYDFNTSDLDRASDGQGGYELSLIYIIRRVKPLGIKPPCPLY